MIHFKILFVCSSLVNLVYFPGSSLVNIFIIFSYSLSNNYSRILPAIPSPFDAFARAGFYSPRNASPKFCYLRASKYDAIGVFVCRNLNSDLLPLFVCCIVQIVEGIFQTEIRPLFISNLYLWCIVACPCQWFWFSFLSSLKLVFLDPSRFWTHPHFLQKNNILTL